MPTTIFDDGSTLTELPNGTFRSTDATDDVNVIRGPLASLYTTPNNASLRYPSDLGGGPLVGPPNEKNQKNHWVNFSIKEIRKNASFVGTNGQSNAVVNLPSFGELATNASKSVKEYRKSYVGGIENIFTGGLSGLVEDGASEALGYIGGIAESGLNFAPQYSENVGNISLYMPDTLNATYHANFEEMSLTKDLGPALTTLRAVDSIAGAKKTQSIGNIISSNPAALQALSGGLDTLGRGIPGVNVDNAVTLLQRAQGYALNPQLQMVYRGTGLRSFQLSFIFTPKSSDEAQKVNEIIDKFRYHHSPSLSVGLGTSSNFNQAANSTENMFLVPPSVFNLQFVINGKESTVLPRYGDCVLESIDINNAPNGLAVYDDGAMVQTQLNLSFKEMDILTRDKMKSFENDQAR